MSQIASFYLLKDGRRQELSNGDCSGAVYMAIWDWCESELDLDVRFPAPQDVYQRQAQHIQPTVIVQMVEERPRPSQIDAGHKAVPAADVPQKMCIRDRA